MIAFPFKNFVVSTFPGVEQENLAGKS